MAAEGEAEDKQAVALDLFCICWGEGLTRGLVRHLDVRGDVCVKGG